MKVSTYGSAAIVFCCVFLFGLTGIITVHAATAPTLGAASAYAVYGDAGVTNDLSATTHIWGNVGHNGFGATNLIVGQVDTGVINIGAGVDAADSTAYGQMAAQSADSALDLAGTHTVTPGAYNIAATTLNGTLTLNGAGVYIFKSTSSISTSGAAKVKLINGATACNVFWQIPTSMTIGAGSEIVGTIITNTGLISLADSASLQGRALAHTQVTLIKNQITEPTCSASADEDVIIHVTKTASKKNLKSGPDKVTFTYKVTNTGDVALSDVSVKDDKCDDVEYVSGDDNSDDLLDTNEEWKYTCKKTIRKNTTNTVTAKGTANGEEVKDTDTAKVTVSDKTTVSTPGLPNAGIGPDEKNIFWNIIFPTGIFVALFSLYLARKKLAI